MAVNIYNSRRNFYNECYYWKRETKGKNDNETLIHKIKPDGVFYAKEDNTVHDTIELGSVWQLAQKKVHIITNDYVDNIRKNDLVKFDDEIWVVEYVEVHPIEKRNEFSKHVDKITTLYLRG